MEIIGLLKSYAVWHYTTGIRELFEVWRNFLWFGYHFFSLPLLTRTLFAPIYRLRMTSRNRMDIGAMAGNAVVTTLMRMAGLVVRIGVLAVGFVFETMLCLALAPGLAVWIILPPLAAVLAITGVTLFFH